MAASSKSGDLVAGDESTTGERNENLAHDDVTNVTVWTTEVDHETRAEDVDWYEDNGNPLVAVGVAKEKTDNDTPEARANVVNVGDVTSIGKTESVYNLKEGGKVEIPAVEGDVEREDGQSGTTDGAVDEQTPWDEWLRCDELFVEGEEDQEDNSNDDHGDDIVTTPAIGLGCGNVEWQEEEHQAGKQDDHSTNVKLDEVVLDRLNGGATMRWCDQESLFASLGLIPQEETYQWQDNDWVDDAEHAKTPSPARSGVQGLSSGWTSKSGSDERGLREREHQSSVPELGSVGNEDLEDVEDAVVSDIVDDIGSGVCGHVGGAGHDDQANNSDSEHNGKTFGTTPDINHLSNGQTKDTSDDKSHGRRDGGQLVSGKGTVHIRCQAKVDLRLEREDEVGEIHAGEISCVVNQRCDRM